MTKTKDESLDAKDYLDEYVSKLKSEYSAIKENEALSEKNKDLLVKNLVDETKIKTQTGEFQTMRKIKDDDMKAIKALIRQRVGDPKKITKEDIEEAVQFFYGASIEKGSKLKNPYPRNKGYSDVWSMLTTDKEKQFFKDNVQITKDGKINFIKMGNTFSLFSLDSIDEKDMQGIIDYSQRDEYNYHGEKGKKYFMPSKVSELIEKSGKKIFKHTSQFEHILQFLPGGYDNQMKYVYFLKLFGLCLPGDNDLYTRAVVDYDSAVFKYWYNTSNDAVVVSLYKEDINLSGLIVGTIDRKNYFQGRTEHYEDIYKPEYTLRSDTVCSSAYPNFLVYENNPI